MECVQVIGIELDTGWRPECYRHSGGDGERGKGALTVAQVVRRWVDITEDEERKYLLKPSLRT